MSQFLRRRWAYLRPSPYSKLLNLQNVMFCIHLATWNFYFCNLSGGLPVMCRTFQFHTDSMIKWFCFSSIFVERFPVLGDFVFICVSPVMYTNTHMQTHTLMHSHTRWSSYPSLCHSWKAMGLFFLGQALKEHPGTFS